MAKMNEQTVFVTFEGSSTLEFQTIENVPVYEPAPLGWVDVVCHRDSVTKIDSNGYVERFYLQPGGHIERWYTRPDIASVATMFERGAKGYYYEFKSGSIRSMTKKGSYYWGPVYTWSDEEEIGRTRINTAYAIVDHDFLREEHEHFLQEHVPDYDYGSKDVGCPECRRAGVCVCYT